MNSMANSLKSYFGLVAIDQKQAAECGGRFRFDRGDGCDVVAFLPFHNEATFSCGLSSQPDF